MNKLFNHRKFHTHAHTLIQLFSNKIEQLNAIGFLSMCHKLRDLDLASNSVTQQCNYRHQVKTILPALLILDGFACDVTTEQLIASDVSSSLSSESSKDLCISPALSVTRQLCDVPEVTIFRPHSCNSQPVDNVSGTISKRPLTAGKSCLSGFLLLLFPYLL